MVIGGVDASGVHGVQFLFFPYCNTSGTDDQELGCVACGFDWQGAAS